MSLTDPDLRAIVERSSTMMERVSGPFRGAAGCGSADVAPRLARLTQRVAGGDPVRFERYLRVREWDDAAVARALGCVRFDDDARLPEWTAVLRELDPRELDLPGRDEGAARVPEPFEEALSPFVRVAQRRLRERVRVRDGAMADAAWPAFEHALLRRLARIAARALYAEFGAFRSSTAHHLDDAAVDVLQAGAGYDAFVAALRAGGLDRVLVAYPVLARLLAARVLDWVEATAEFLHRFDADARLLERTFGGGTALGPLIGFSPDLSDPHRGGRTVALLTFASGRQVIYKPRNLAPEAAFSSLIEWLNRAGAGMVLPLKAPVVLDRGTHGWMECVVPSACADKAAVERYYHRAGMLLCLAYVLGVSDLHQGNVIACGEHPVLIDLEACMGAPLRPTTPDGSEHDPDGHQVWDSLLRTGLLPVRRLGLRGRPHRDGGLVEIDASYGRRVTHWACVNTDFMAPEIRPPSTHPQNVPHLDGRPAAAAEYVGEITEGFAEMSRVLQRRRRALLRPGSVLREFRRARTRVVLRDTALYATLLEQSLHPRLLGDGRDWSIELALLDSAGTREEPGETPARSARTWRAEAHALSRLDVPIFTASIDGTAIETETGDRLTESLDEPGRAGAASRLAALDDERTRVHVQCIRLALRSPPEEPPASPDGPWLAAATAVARTLRSIAGDVGGDPAGWIGIRGLGGSAQRGLQPVGWDLYGGRCGIALLFAALESRGVTVGEGPFARCVLAPLVDALNGLDTLHALPPAMPIGTLGIGGIVYALTAAATLLKSEAVLDAATRAAERLTPRAIADSEHVDVISGAAGAALALLALCERKPSQSPSLLDRAVLCGHRLLRDVPSTGGAGFAHGRAGVAFALARLYRRTGERAFRDAAIAASRIDLRTDTPPRAARNAALHRSWCQGAAGIGLARLELSALVECPELRGGVDALVRDAAVTASTLSRSDQVCCGNAGRLELALRAADALGDPRWRDEAATGAAHVLARAATRGSYAVSAIDDVFCPGLYQGLAGIGYQSLRIHDRGLPSVLLWE